MKGNNKDNSRNLKIKNKKSRNPEIAFEKISTLDKLLARPKNIKRKNTSYL